MINLAREKGTTKRALPAKTRAPQQLLGGHELEIEGDFLNNTNYTLWALRMKKILLANGVWDLVEGTSTSKEIDVKNDSSASAYLFQGLPEDFDMQVWRDDNQRKKSGTL
ncbi:zinc finger, CCHC-type containing protein [Tanacetum coccineum]